MTDDILDKLPDKELTKEEHEALLLRSEHAIVAPLSPAARSVLEEFGKHPLDKDCLNYGLLYGTLPAALRVAADLIKLENPLGDTDADAGVFAAHHAIRNNILAIAAELEVYRDAD